METGIHLLQVADKLIAEIDELAIIALACASPCAFDFLSALLLLLVCPVATRHCISLSQCVSLCR